MMITREAERLDIYWRVSTSRINRSEGKLSFTLNTHQSNCVMVPRCRVDAAPRFDHDATRLPGSGLIWRAAWPPQRRSIMRLIDDSCRNLTRGDMAAEAPHVATCAVRPHARDHLQVSR
jgi:hypothetical protein